MATLFKSRAKPLVVSGSTRKAASPGFLDRMFASLRGRRSPPMEALGAGGTAVYGGYVVERDKNTRLVGAQRWVTFSELLTNISIVAASVRYYLGLIGKANWTVEAAKDSGAEGERIAELVDSIIHEMQTPWHRVVRRAAMYRIHGFSIQEWTAIRREDGAIGFVDVEPRPQFTITQWDLDESGTVHGVIQQSPQSQSDIYLPRKKLVYVVDDSITDSPEGLGFMRHVAPVAQRLQLYEKLEAFGFETDLRGVPVGKAPYAFLRSLVESGSITQEQMNAALKPMEDMIKGHVKDPSNAPLGIVIDSLAYASQDESATPSGVPHWSLDLLQGSNNTQADVALAIQRLTRELARIMGTEGILLGESGSGSLAMARDKSESFALIVDGALVDVAWSLNKDLVEPLFLLNGWDPKLKPRLVPEKIQHRQVTEVTNALVDLAQAGGTLAPDDPAINVVRTLLGLPEQKVVDIDLDASLLGDDGGDGEGEDDGGGKPNGEEDSESVERDADSNTSNQSAEDSKAGGSSSEKPKAKKSRGKRSKAG